MVTTIVAVTAYFLLSVKGESHALNVGKPREFLGSLTSSARKPGVLDLAKTENFVQVKHFRARERKK